MQFSNDDVIRNKCSRSVDLGDGLLREKNVNAFEHATSLLKTEHDAVPSFPTAVVSTIISAVRSIVPRQSSTLPTAAWVSYVSGTTFRSGVGAMAWAFDFL